MIFCLSVKLCSLTKTTTVPLFAQLSGRHVAHLSLRLSHVSSELACSSSWLASVSNGVSSRLMIVFSLRQPRRVENVVQRHYNKRQSVVSRQKQNKQTNKKKKHLCCCVFIIKHVYLYQRYITWYEIKPILWYHKPLVYRTKFKSGCYIILNTEINPAKFLQTFQCM